MWGTWCLPKGLHTGEVQGLGFLSLASLRKLPESWNIHAHPYSTPPPIAVLGGLCIRVMQAAGSVEPQGVGAPGWGRESCGTHTACAVKFTATSGSSSDDLRKDYG